MRSDSHTAMSSPRWTWVRTHLSPVAVRVDLPAPDSPVVGSLIVIPPIGRERVTSFRALRCLALNASKHGYVAISLDLPGDGDSPRAATLGLAEDWSSAVQSVEELARMLAPGAPVHQVGLRLGACLLGAPEVGASEIRVLWEPVSGRSFVRQQRLARRLGVPLAVVPEGVEFPGVYLSAKEADDIAGLVPPVDDTHLRPGYLIHKESDPDSARRLATCSPPMARVPFASIEEIIGLLHRGRSTGIPSWEPVTSAEVAPGVVETITQVGPGQLRAVIATPAGQPTPGAGVAFTAMGSELSHGPGDLWVRIARELSVRGVPSIRGDRRGLGESLFSQEPMEAPCYTDDAVDDVSELLKRISAETAGAPTVAVGVCAGGWCFFRAVVSSSVAHLISVNQVHWSVDPSLYDRLFYRRYHASRELSPLAGLSLGEHAGRGFRSLWSDGSRLLLRAGRVWQETLRGDRIGPMLDLVGKSTKVDIVLGTSEHRRFVLKGGLLLMSRPGVKVNVNRNIDHSLLSECGRREVAGFVLQAVEGIRPKETRV